MLKKLKNKIIGGWGQRSFHFYLKICYSFLFENLCKYPLVFSNNDDKLDSKISW
jgi:hypothetical protein